MSHHLPSNFQELVRAEMDRTGMGEVAAATIVSGRLGGPTPAPPASDNWRITGSISAALTAPPAANEPDVIPPPPPFCPDCHGAGWYKECVPYGHPNFGVLFPCRCKLDELAARRRERQAATLQALAQELGGELASKRLANFDPTRGADAEERRQLAHALATAQRYVQDWRGWLYLWGPCGVGKSHLAAAIAHAAIEQGKRVSYASVPSLLRYLKAGFGDNSSDARLIALQLIDVLVLDDLGAEYHARAGDWTDQTLFELINYRYLYNGLTVITSNLPPHDHEARIGSRIRARARLVLMVAADQRAGETYEP